MIRQAIRCLPWFGVLLFSFALQGADLALVVVGSFGEQFTECIVTEFKPVTPAVHVENNLSDRFRGLTAKNLPVGEFNISVRCGLRILHSAVTISAERQLKILSYNSRLIRGDHVPHKLRVQRLGKQVKDEIWWIVLRAVYRDDSYTGQFERENGTAAITDPEPGSYLVSSLSSSGYECHAEVDLTESTQLWTFDPKACIFATDRFAHVVTERDRREHKVGGWYREMREHSDHLFRELDKAAKQEKSPPL